MTKAPFAILKSGKKQVKILLMLRVRIALNQLTNKTKTINTKTMPTINLNILKNSWTAEVKLNNGKVITIWYTAWPSIKHIVSEIIAVSSDYPKNIINVY